MKRSKRALDLYASSSLVLASVQGGCVSEASQPDTQPAVAAAPQSSTGRSRSTAITSASCRNRTADSLPSPIPLCTVPRA